MGVSEIISINPATKETVGSISINTRNQLEKVFRTARNAKKVWANLKLTQRAKILRRVRKNLIAHQDELSSLIAAETGKTNWEGFLEVFTAAEHLRHICHLGPEYLEKEARSSGVFKNKKCYVNYVPHGVVGIISPWNYPLILTASPVVEALMAGNSVVLKPSELTPLTGKRLVEIFNKAGVPKEVFQVVFGFKDVGAALVDSEKIDMICFTGSVGVGREIALSCANKLKPVILELGGKDPMIVLEDANLERAANAAVWGGFSNAGQTCISVERVYVVEKVADKFISLVKTKTEQLNIGPDKSNDDVGALINKKHQEKIMNHMQEAKEGGSNIITGGENLSSLGGHFIKPAVIEIFDDSLDIMKNETFGPEICIMRVKNELEAIKKANSSGYGLSASVFTKKKKRGEDVAKQIKAGSVCINDIMTNYITPDLPFGGVGISGMGRVHGPEGLRSFCQTQSVLVNRFGFNREPWWFPVGMRTQKLFRLLAKKIYG